ncbi:hypothetical protein ACPESL_08085 [Psychrobacter pocilloporae]
MQEQDIQAWERELEHAQMMQKQRETITFAGGKTYELPIKDDNNEK